MSRGYLSATARRKSIVTEKQIGGDEERIIQTYFGNRNGLTRIFADRPCQGYETRKTSHLANRLYKCRSGERRGGKECLC